MPTRSTSSAPCHGFFGHLSLPPGEFVVRTLVRNGHTGASAVRVTGLVVPAPGAAEPALLPPLFPEAAGRWVMVRETLAQGEKQPPYRSCSTARRSSPPRAR